MRVRSLAARVPGAGLGIFGLAGAAAAVGCAGGEGPAAGADVARRDSAGIEIVESPAAQPPAWSVSEAPRVSVGTFEGSEEYELFNVVGARRLPDGRLVIANGGTHELRFYDAEGRFLSTSGSQGEGPGEFQRMASLSVPGDDSIYVWDNQNFRVSVFELDGTFARDHRLEAPWEGAFPGYRGHFSDGTILVTAGDVISEPPADGTVLQRENLGLRYSATGEPLDTLASLVTGRSLLRSFDGGRSLSIYSVPFDRGTVWAIGGRRFHLSHGPRPAVESFDETGALVRIVRAELDARPVTPELRAAAIEATLADYTNDEARATARESYEAVAFPDSVQAFDRLVVDDEDHLWARRYPLPAEERATWIVFDPTGAVVARVNLPEEMVVWQVGRDFVLGRIRDELDVERVVLLDLERPVAEPVRGD